ncbi:MAG: hypothetical protein ACJ72N_24060 [Labedaea sp.]
MLVIVAALGLLGGAGTGPAAPAGDPEPVDQPRPLLAVTASCHSATAGAPANVRVVVYEDRARPYVLRVTRVTGTFSETRATAFDNEHFVQVATFTGLPAGEYAVAVDEPAQDVSPADNVHVVVRECAELKPTDDPLGIEVECKAGWGVVTFQVANPKSGTPAAYTLTIDPPLTAHLVTARSGAFVRITENGYDDKTHIAKLTGSGLDLTRRFEVTCQRGNAAKVDATGSCEAGKGKLTVGVLNPNGLPVNYTIGVKGQAKTVSLGSVGGGVRAVATVDGLPAGAHEVTVTGSDRTAATGTATIDCGTTTTATSATTTTTTAPTTGTNGATATGGTATTTTAAPAPQGRSGGLASTGAAVIGLAGLGLLAVGLGALVLIFSRRRARHHGGTDAT